MGLVDKSNSGGFMDQIRCDEPSYLIWKWHPNGSQEGNNSRENAIRWGSSLRVKDGEVAVFVYKQPNGTVQDFIEGPFDEMISTKNLPVISRIIGLAYDGGTPFQAEIYFINLAQIIQVRFGVPFFDVYDPRFPDFGVPIAIRGTISFKISDYREFIKLHRLNAFSLSDFQQQIKDVVIRYTKDTVANAPAANNIPVVAIESKTSIINDTVEYDIAQRLKEDFGVEVSGVDIGAIEIDKSSDGYVQLMRVTKEVEATKVKAETEDYVERMRIAREEDQYARHKGTQTANIGAVEAEIRRDVGMAGAEALGKMGENGAGDVDLGSGTGGMGFNPAAMMAGMALGGAVGQNIVGAMNGAMNPNGTSTPPPIPSISYFVAVNGQATGPFTIDALKEMFIKGSFGAEYLVWKQGMENWLKAGEVAELKPVFDSMPPIPNS